MLMFVTMSVTTLTGSVLIFVRNLAIALDTFDMEIIIQTSAVAATSVIARIIARQWSAPVEIWTV